MSKGNNNNGNGGLNILEVLIGAFAAAAKECSDKGIEDIPTVAIPFNQFFNPDATKKTGDENNKQAVREMVSRIGSDLPEGVRVLLGSDISVMKLNCMAIEKLMLHRQNDYEALVELELIFGSNSQAFLKKREEIRKSYKELLERLNRLREDPELSRFIVKTSASDIEPTTFNRLAVDLVLFDRKNVPDENLNDALFEMMLARSFYVLLDKEIEKTDDETEKKTYLDNKYILLQGYPILEGWFFGEEFLGINNVSSETYSEEGIMKYLSLSPEDYRKAKDGHAYAHILETIDRYTKEKGHISPIEQKVNDMKLLNALLFANDEQIQKALADGEIMLKNQGRSFPKMEMLFAASKAREARKSGDNDQ